MSLQPVSDVEETGGCRVNDLSVIATDRSGLSTVIVDEISFSVERGQVLALIGESGSGKTTISLACMGYQRPGCQIVSGEVVIDGIDVLALSTSDRRQLRGQKISYVAQSAAASFNAARRLNQQVIETPLINGLMTRQAAIEKAIDLYRQLDLPDADKIGRRYPHQVSGGQLQRLMAAMAMICDPELLILDEPTTALDVTTQIEVLAAFKHLINARRTAAIYVSHDLAVVAQIADNVLVLNNGRSVEYGPIEQIIHDPQHTYTQALISAAHILPTSFPVGEIARTAHQKPLLQIENVDAAYGREHHLALDNINLKAYSGRTLGVIGESGSGKTTLGRVISGLMKPRSGDISLNDERLEPQVDKRTRLQQQKIQFVFQMADVALNPRHRVNKILRRPVQFYSNLERQVIDDRVVQLLELVELPAQYRDRFPRELSGGERQRVNLARALAAEPDIVICDEVTSALDTVVADAILKLLESLQKQLNLSFIFISHDISTIARMADTIAVMHEGKVVAWDDAEKILEPPHHPYTQKLLDSVPELRTDWLSERIGQR